MSCCHAEHFPARQNAVIILKGSGLVFRRGTAAMIRWAFEKEFTNKINR